MSRERPPNTLHAVATLGGLAHGWLLHATDVGVVTEEDLLTLGEILVDAFNGFSEQSVVVSPTLIGHDEP